VAEPENTGCTWPARVQAASPACSRRWEKAAPPSRYEARNSSSWSAITSATWVVKAASAAPQGSKAAWRVPSSRTDPIGTMSLVSFWRISPRSCSPRALARSILFTKMRVGRPSRCSARISTRVCACTPSTAEITSTAPSSTVSVRSTSAMKSGWPGVSIRLTVRSSTANDTTADRIVMPRCRSRARVSVWVLPSSTRPIVPMTPAANSSRSVRLVLPASTCATIPRFSALTKRHVLMAGNDSFLAGHERWAHDALLVSWRSP